jgi:hypothetical protein
MLVRTLRDAMNKSPVAFIGLAGLWISLATAEPFSRRKEEPRDEYSLQGFVYSLVCRKYRETTAMLAILGELIVDDDHLRDWCRREVSTRHDRIPRWIARLSTVEVGRVMRRSDVLGDVDEVVVSFRLTDSTNLTLCAVLDHNHQSVVVDSDLLTGPLEALLRAREKSDLETTFVDMDPADARAWLENGLRYEKYARRSQECHYAAPIMKWMVARLPEGGTAYEKPDWDDEAITELLDEFFASPSGAPFPSDDYRDMLRELCESGYGDPLRWSEFRISNILRNPYRDEHVPLEIALDAPAMLRAYVPFAHSRSGVRQGLTDDAIKTIDEMSRDYRRRLVDEAMAYLDGDDTPPWPTYPGRASGSR